jgi:hypothetical protein
MARRAPKNPINDIVDTVGGWLGGRGPGTNPQVQAAMQATRAIARTADTATGGFGQALLSDAQRMAMTGSSTPSALYKTAAVNLGAAAAGVGAAKVVGKAASKVVESGVPARIVNKARGEIVGLHGSPTQGLKVIEPRIPTKGPNKGKGEQVYLFRTDQSPARNANLAKFGKQNTDLSDSIELSRKYATGEMGWLKPQTPSGQGSVYVVRTPTKTTDLSQETLNRGILATSSTSKAKVVSEIQLGSKSPEQIAAEVTKKLKRSGVKIPKKK